MALHIEAVVNDLQIYMQANFPSVLQEVMDESADRLSIPPPANTDYFIGEPSRFRAYNAPCVFLITDSTRHLGEGIGQEMNVIDFIEHRVLVAVLVEDRDEERLTRMCWRMAQAVDTMLRDRDITDPTVNTRSTKVFIPSIDYGVLFASKEDQRTFRKDVVVECLIRHWDLLG